MTGKALMVTTSITCLRVLAVKKDYIFDLQKMLFNPNNASVAVEWDGVLRIDYTNKSIHEELTKDAPPGNAVFSSMPNLL
jgi:hypothetical protein